MKKFILALIGIACLLLFVALFIARKSNELASTPVVEQTPATQPSDAAGDSIPKAAARHRPGVFEKDAMHEKHIATACWEWAQSHHQMPDNLAMLVLNGSLDPADLVDDRTGNAPLAVTGEMMEKARQNPASFTRDLTAHCDYIYLGQGVGGAPLQENAVTQNVVLVYDKAGPALLAQMNVAFIDGHVEQWAVSRLHAEFRQTSAFRTKMGLSPVDVDAIQREIAQ